MPRDSITHHRRSIRLEGYDYSQPGAYFVTICTKDRCCLFGDVINGECKLDQFGRIVEEEWKRSTVIRREIELDDWVVIPNHMHGIVYIVYDETVGAHGRAPLHHL
jgi:REP element-mobilizing transposase RayT